MGETQAWQWASSTSASSAYPRTDTLPIVREVEPVVLACEERLEAGEIPSELVDVLWDSGVFRAMMPRDLGGLEMHPVDWLDMIYELSRINGSVGWLACVVTGGFDLRPPAVMAELLKDRRWLVVGSGGRLGQARKVEGGYRVSGQWVFATGIPFATFVSGMVHEIDADGEVVINPKTGRPLVLSALFAAEDIVLGAEFDALGLRGSGSGGFSADDVFVPDHIMMPAAVPPAEYLARPLYREFFLGMGHAAHALGLARGAVDAYIALGHRKAAAGSRRQATFGRDQVDQVALAKADSIIRSSQLFAWDATGAAFDDAHLHEPITYELRVRFAQANTYASRMAHQAMLLVYGAAGTDGVIAKTRLERILRDLTTVVQHTVVLEKTYDTIGQYLLTRDGPGGPVIDTATTMIQGPHPQDERATTTTPSPSVA
jgi:alkylation response protein AidB-like acyl-CoA dehydrogenase